MKLYYWALPFRCIYIEIFLHLNAISYERVDSEQVIEKKLRMKSNLAYPGFAPPFLEIDKRSFSQMPATLMYLNEKFKFYCDDIESSYFSMKCLLDVTDLMAEITRNNGSMMWDSESWELFEKGRLTQWLQIFELQAKNRSGTFLLSDSPSVADIAYLGCFSLLMHSFPYFDKMIRSSYPEILHIVDKFKEIESINNYLNKQWETFGTLYCGGQIENSIREQIDNK